MILDLREIFVILSKVVWKLSCKSRLDWFYYILCACGPFKSWYFVVRNASHLLLEPIQSRHERAHSNQRDIKASNFRPQNRDSILVNKQIKRFYESAEGYKNEWNKTVLFLDPFKWFCNFCRYFGYSLQLCSLNILDGLCSILTFGTFEAK